MQDDFDLDGIYQELKDSNTKPASELKNELGERFVNDLVNLSGKDISLGEYLSTTVEDNDSLLIDNKLVGLLDDLEKGTDMNEELDIESMIDLDEEDELEALDLSGINTSQRKEIEKNLFINHKKRVRQSGETRIKAYANTNAKLATETELRPLSLKRYNS